MIIRWVRDRILADRATVAELYGVSERSVRRHCPVIGRQGRVALVDALQAEEQLGGVAPREGGRVHAAMQQARAARGNVR